MIDLRKFIDWVVAKQNIIGLVSTVIIILLSIYGYTQGVFTDKSKLEALLKSCGVWAPIMFVALQAIQVVIPILPGSIGCLFGVILRRYLWWVYMGISYCQSLWARICKTCNF